MTDPSEPVLPTSGLHVKAIDMPERVTGQVVHVSDSGNYFTVKYQEGVFYKNYPFGDMARFEVLGHGEVVVPKFPIDDPSGGPYD